MDGLWRLQNINHVVGPAGRLYKTSLLLMPVLIFYCKPLLFCKKPYVIGGKGGHFWIQHPRKHKVYQKYSMQLKKKLFLQTCVINPSCSI
jgi:hypothetical protein